MQAEETMTIAERRKYLQRMQVRYRSADRAGRSALLGEMVMVTGLHRKYVTALMNGSSLARRPRQRQRGRVYGVALRVVVARVWESLDSSCAERLTPAHPQAGTRPTGRHLATFGACRLTPEQETVAQQGTISRSTVQRLLGTMAHTQRVPAPRLPRRGPEEANRLRRAVPMHRLSWRTTTPGHFEAGAPWALVHHNGGSATGEYVHTIQLVDVATGWSERAAVLGRSQVAMEAGFRRILAQLPFPVRELHPDNGSEFFNDHLVRFWGEAITGLTLSRSRPYRQPDTRLRVDRLVEQKNRTLVRAYLGYGRLDTLAQATALDALYDQLWCFYNLFQPVLHLTTKSIANGTLRRTWDTATSPYQRLLATGVLAEPRRATLDTRYAQTNPLALRNAIHDDLAKL